MPGGLIPGTTRLCRGFFGARRLSAPGPSQCFSEHTAELNVDLCALLQHCWHSGQQKQTWEFWK